MSTSTANTTAAAVKRSWADIVKCERSSSRKDSQPHFTPGARGSFLCHCRGEVLTMLTHYGWLMLFGCVEHPAADKHEGHVYVHKDDIVDGKEFVPGDVVSFYLYIDSKGLGAEVCSLEPASSERYLGENANIDEHQKGCATESQLPLKPSEPWHPRRVIDISLRLADIFALEDDDDDDEGRRFGGMTLDDRRELVQETFGENDVYSHGDKEPDGGHAFCASLKGRRSPSPDGSTSAGTTSDSEGEGSCDSFPVYTKVKMGWPSAASVCQHKASGLIVPSNFRPPPGLSFPIED